MKMLLLHGSRSAASVLNPLATALGNANTFIPLNMLGHGGRPIPDTLSVKAMAEDILEQMDERGIDAAYIFGYSFGGYLALYLSRFYPERVLGVITLATKVIFDEHTVNLFTKLSSVNRIRAHESRLAEMNTLYPSTNWEPLVEQLAAIYTELGKHPALSEADFKLMERPTLVISANQDQIVPWSESLRLAVSIPGAHHFTFAGVAHPLEIIPITLLKDAISHWLDVHHY